MQNKFEYFRYYCDNLIYKKNISFSLCIIFYAIYYLGILYVHVAETNFFSRSLNLADTKMIATNSILCLQLPSSKCSKFRAFFGYWMLK